MNKRRKKINQTLAKRNWTKQPNPMLSASNIHYTVDDHHQGIAHGGIGLIHLLAKKTGLLKQIDENLNLLKRYLPYHESDHVINMAYNILAGGTCLEDIELLRNDNAWLDALDAEIIPDPTTAGDFLRRFEEQDILDLMDAKNTIRSQLWEKQPESFKKEAIINIDGTITETFGECKEGMDISYNGKWGYAPLIISLEKTREALFIVLRKFLKVMKGETFLFNKNRYFFYITNDEEKSTTQIVEFYRKRADHENDIDQLKHGVKAMKNPSNSLLSNWAYMVIASLAWDLKAWYMAYLCHIRL